MASRGSSHNPRQGCQSTAYCLPLSPQRCAAHGCHLGHTELAAPFHQDAPAQRITTLGTLRLSSVSVQSRPTSAQQPTLLPAVLSIPVASTSLHLIGTEYVLVLHGRASTPPRQLPTLVLLASPPLVARPPHIAISYTSRVCLCNMKWNQSSD